MAEGEVRQYFVRNEKGTVWGPLTLSTIELLIDNGAIQGRLQVSEDGLNFAFPGRFPHLRDAFPREMWGDVIAPGETVRITKTEIPVQMGGPSAPPAPTAPVAGTAAMAGPGAVAQATAPRPAPVATAQPAAPRPNPGAPAQAAQPGAVARPGAPVAGPAGAIPPGAQRPVPGAPGQVVPQVAAPGVRPAAGPPGAMPPNPSGTFRAAPPPGAAMPPGAMPNNPSGSFRAAPPPGAAMPPGAGARPPTATPAGGMPAVSAAPGAAPASAAPRAPVPSGSHAAVAPPPAAAASAPRPAGPPSTTGQPAVTPVGTATPPPVAPETVGPPPAQGSLDQSSPIHLYGRISAGTHTGLLTLTLADRAIQIHFRKGSPEFVDSSHAEDALGTVLMQAKLLNPDQLRLAEGARGRFGGDLLAALFGLGLLQPASAFSQLAQRALTILHKGLRAESGTFTYEPKELPAAKAMPLGNRWALLSDQVRRMPAVDLKRRLQPVLNLPIMKAGGMVPASDLRLTPHEVRVLTVIDGVRSIAQLLVDLAQDGEHILRVAFLLKELDAVSFAAVAQRAPEAAKAPNPAPAAAATAKPAAPNPAPAAAAAARPAAPNPAPAARHPLLRARRATARRCRQARRATARRSRRCRQARRATARRQPLPGPPRHSPPLPPPPPGPRPRQPPRASPPRHSPLLPPRPAECLGEPMSSPRCGRPPRRSRNRTHFERLGLHASRRMPAR